MSGGSLHRPGSGSFSCFHGEKAKRPPLDGHALTDVHIITRRVDEWYHEAPRRLPVGEIPELAGCVAARGLCLGVADPVSNIILNAVALLRHRAADRGERAKATLPHPMDSSISESGLVVFMTAYFRYLGDTQARRYLHLASHDLALAVRLVRHDSLPPHHQRRPLLPDGGRLKRALRAAANYARHPAPDLLAGLMTARYPATLLAGVLAKIRRTEPQLTAGDVAEIGDLLMDRRWPPYPPPVEVEFRCRPESGGVACTRTGDGTLQVLTCVGEEEEDIVATITITSSRNQQQHLRYISGVTFDDSADMETKLAGCLQAAASPPSAVAVDYDASPCEHIISLKLLLLDAIHGFYIRALAVMPRGAPSPRLLGAVLAAGHCYGLMDPVSNIILSSAWYAATFPPDAADAGLPDGGFLDTKPMSRMGLRSLNGLVAMVCDTDTGCCRSEHEALEYLNSCDCDLSGSTQQTAFAAAAKAAKHPHHAAFGSFLASLSSDEEHKLRRLRCLLDAGGGYVISDAHWGELKAILVEETEPLRPFAPFALGVRVLPATPQRVPRTWGRRPKSGSVKKLKAVVSQGTPPPSAFGGDDKPASESKLDILRTHLNKLLHQYCCNHPWEPTYRLDIICGVWEFGDHSRQKMCHANFLASAMDDATTMPRERTLFFAELLFEPSVFPDERFRFGKEASQSSCCPVYDYRASTGRCSFRSAVDDMERLLHSEYLSESDFRDVEVSNIFNNFHYHVVGATS